MRTWARVTGAAVAVSAVLLLSGCTEDDSSGDGGGNAAEDKPAQESGGSQSGGGDGGGDTGGDGGGETSKGPVDVADVKGNWDAGSVADGDYVVLNLTADSTAVVVTEKDTCNGTYSQDGDTVKIEMQCRKGNDFEQGTIEGMADEKLTVAWASGETDVFEPTN